MTVKLNVRVTSKSRCKEGFYLVMNGERVRFTTRGAAIANALKWLAAQRIQIITVRDYARLNKVKIAARMAGNPDASIKKELAALATVKEAVCAFLSEGQP